MADGNWRWRATSCATFGEGPGLSLCRTRTACLLMCLRAKLHFCVESHKGAFAFTAPDHCDFVAAQAPTQTDGRAGPAFSHARLPTYCDKAGRGEPCTADDATGIGGFSKKGGAFSTILPRFLRKVSHFFLHRTGRAPPRLPFAKAAPGFGQSTGAHGPPQRRRCNESPAVGRRQGRKKPDAAKNPREDVGRRA